MAVRLGADRRPVSGYVAPASKVFTVAHIPAGEHMDGTQQTLCGLVMLAEEFWVGVLLRPGESVCARCQNPSRSASEDQGALL
jgi:hypothetical protein